MLHRSTVRAFLSIVGVVAVSMMGVVVIPAAAQAATPLTKRPVVYYLSLGDSYSVGYQPGIGATAGYTAYVAKKVKMQLENFGCGGATTTSILDVVGCTSPYGPPAATDAVAYPTETQEQAALDFIAANPGHVGLITVSIGGNDVTACASAANPISCIVAAESDRPDERDCVGERPGRRPHLCRRHLGQDHRSDLSGRDPGRLRLSGGQPEHDPGQRVDHRLRPADQPHLEHGVHLGPGGKFRERHPGAVQEGHDRRRHRVDVVEQSHSQTRRPSSSPTA